jgi:hypothetical protein
MLLRASGEVTGNEVDLSAITDRKAAATSGVPHADALVALAEAVVTGDDETLASARADVIAKVGPEGFVDACAVVGNFQRMVRIADSTGIPLDAAMELMTGDMRVELGIAAFGSAANTPSPGPLKRMVGRALAPIAFPAARLFMRLRAPRS